MILQHSWLQLEITTYSEAELESTLRYLFSNPIIREYWISTKEVRRRILASDSFEHHMNVVADEVCSEYEHLLRTHRPGPVTPPVPPWSDAVKIAEAA